MARWPREGWHYLVKQCVQCHRWFHNRKIRSTITGQRWAEKVTCTNSCHAKRRWASSKELPADRFWRQVDKRGKARCWPYLGAARDAKGYGGFHLEGKRMMRAHRMAWILTNGPIPDHLVVTHRCDNKPCCNPYHLRLGTIADNNADSYARRHLRCANRDTGHHSTKLTTERLEAMLAEYDALPTGPKGKRKGGYVSALAAKYGVALETVCTLAKKARDANKRR